MAKILLADDSSFMRKVLIDILSKNGYETVIEAENGKQAVEKYDAEKPDLVLLDIIMPEMDGIAVLKDIVPKGAKALIISAVGQDDIVEQANAAGAKGYIIKPFEEAKVIEEVKKILGEGSDTPAAPETASEETPTPDANAEDKPTPEATPAPDVTPEVKPVETPVPGSTPEVTPAPDATPAVTETPVVPAPETASAPITPIIPPAVPEASTDSAPAPETNDGDNKPQG